MELSEFSTQVIVLLFLVGLIAGFLDTLVGGGGLITIPALMMTGVPPIYALGTNKLQSSMGSGTAAAMMFLRKKIQWQQVWPLMIMAFIGSLVGSVAVQYLDTDVLEWLIPLVVLLIAIYFMTSHTRGLEGSEAKLSRQQYGLSAVPGVGFYDGMFGPGTGSFFVLAGVALRGEEIVQATATAKALNFATNFAALLIFIAYAKIIWTLGLAMMLGQTIGANIGARTLLRINPLLLKYLVIAMCVVMLTVWFFKEFG